MQPRLSPHTAPGPMKAASLPARLSPKAGHDRAFEREHEILRDLRRDWRRWCPAERIGAAVIVLVVVALPIVVVDLALSLSLPALGQITDSPLPLARDTANPKSWDDAKRDLPVSRDEVGKHNNKRFNATETKQRASETPELDELYDEVMRRSVPPVEDR